MRSILLISALAACIAATMWRTDPPALREPQAERTSPEPVEIEIVQGAAKIDQAREEEDASLETTVGTPISAPRATRPRSRPETPARSRRARR